MSDELKHKFERLLELGNGLTICLTHMDNLREQDMNARVMTKDMIEQLSKTIARRKYLESLPYCVKTKKGIEVISGHHRIRAARMAGITEIHILLDENKLSRDDIVARQLAHNSIQGYDDKDMLKKLFESINDVDLRLEAFIDKRDIDIKIDESVPLLDVAPDLEFQTIHLLFLPSQIDKWNKVIDVLSGDEKEIDIVPLEQFEQFKKTITEVKGISNIKSVGMALSKMCDIVDEYINKEKEAEKN